MAKYAITDTQTITASPGDTVLLLDQAGANKRAYIYDLLAGDIGTPDDQAREVLARRSTATGTGDALTETALDPAEPGPDLEGTGNHTAEPTYTANSEMIDTGFNQRGSFRWASAPGGELIIPSTDNNGIGLTLIGAGGTDHAATLHWRE